LKTNVLERELGQWNWLSGLPEPVVDELEACCHRLTLPAGESVYHRGKQADCLYQLLKGRLRIRNYSASGRELVFSYFEAGECFGEMGLIDLEPRLHDVEAETEVELAVLPQAAFNRLREQYREIDQQLLLMICRRSRLMSEIYEQAFLLDLPHRLAQRLWDMGVQSQRGNETAKAVLSISHEDLAKIVGGSRQTVSSIIKKWEREGILRQEYGKITLLAPEALKAFAASS